MQFKIVRIFLFLMLLSCGVWQFIFAMQEQLVFVGKTEILEASQIKDSEALTHIARRKHLFEAEMNGANVFLQKALLNNSYYIPAWLGLAELLNDLGRKKQAQEVYTYIEYLLTDLKRWRWEKALTAYQLGREELLPEELKFIIREIPGKIRTSAMQLAFSLWNDPREMLQNVGVENILHLFQYTIANSLPEEALVFWEVIERDKNIAYQEKKMLSFLDMLIKNDFLFEAGAIWSKYFNPAAIIYNGEFEREFIGRAFGWRYRKNKNFTLRFEKKSVDDGTKSIKLHFKGWDNISFVHLSQIVPIKAGHQYTLSFEAKAKDLTTDQRPFVKLYGHKCSGPTLRSDMVKPTQDWTKYEIRFDAPQDCNSIIVRLRRNESRNIDNKISGSIWLRMFEITDMGESSLDDHELFENVLETDVFHEPTFGSNSSEDQNN